VGAFLLRLFEPCQPSQVRQLRLLRVRFDRSNSLADNVNIQEQIVRLCARFGLLREGIALAQQGKSIADAERLISLERKLRRDIRKAGRQYGSRWADPY